MAHIKQLWAGQLQNEPDNESKTKKGVPFFKVNPKIVFFLKNSVLYLIWLQNQAFASTKNLFVWASKLFIENKFLAVQSCKA